MKRGFYWQGISICNENVLYDYVTRDYKGYKFAINSRRILRD